MKTDSIWAHFLVRWLVSSLGLWIAAAFLGSEKLSVGGRWGAWIVAGLFMLVVNGFLILVASWIYGPLYVKNIGVAIVAGIVVGLVNYLVTHILEDFNKK
jgi:uncharacterized membrane protein YvlD (DUF360 family)